MDVLDWLLDKGRVGGALSLVAAAGFFSATWYEYTVVGWVPIVLPVLGGVFALLGLVLVALGRPGGAKFEMPAEGTVDERTEELLRVLECPYWFCTRCVVQAEYGSCPRCVRTVDVMEVRDSSDLKLLRAALGLE